MCEMFGFYVMINNNSYHCRKFKFGVLFNAVNLLSPVTLILLSTEVIYLKNCFY